MVHVEAYVKELEGREVEDHGGELAREEVVAHVELEEKAEVVEALGKSSFEAVWVDVEQCEVGEEAKVLREVPWDVAMVEVNAGHRGEVVWVARGWGTKDPSVVAHLRAAPVSGEVLRVRGDGVLPGLEGNVSPVEPRVWEAWRVTVWRLLGIGTSYRGEGDGKDYRQEG